MPDAPSERRVKRRRGARVIVLARGVSTRAGDFVAGPGSTSVTRGDFVAGPGSTSVARGDFVAGPDSTNVARADFVAGPGSTNVLVLLQGDTDPGFPGSRFWQTPGGGIDPGESPREAAARELYEETGLAVDPDDLGGPVATRTVTHGYSDRILVQHETYFRIEVPRFEPVHAQLSEAEARRRVETAWFPLDDLPPDVWPAQLPSLAVHSGAPVDLGEVEESTLPAW